MKPHVHYLLGRADTNGAALGRAIGVTRVFVHYLLTGQRHSLTRLAQLADLLDVSQEVLCIAIEGKIALGQLEAMVGVKAA